MPALATFSWWLVSREMGATREVLEQELRSARNAFKSSSESVATELSRLSVCVTRLSDEIKSVYEDHKNLETRVAVLEAGKPNGATMGR